MGTDSSVQSHKLRVKKKALSMANKKIPTLSLFSGAGGLDLGFDQADFEIVACVEIEPSYCKTLEANIKRDRHFSKDTVVHCEDIRSFDPTPYQGRGIRCIIGGPPCQTFSAAGRRSGGVIGTEDARGQLYNAYCKILDAIQPDVFVFENVYGLPGANGGKAWREIVHAFESHGYHLTAEVVDAADYGVPQHRERLIMVGYRENSFTFPLPTHGPDSNGSLPLVSVERAIADLQDPGEPSHNNLGGLYGHLLEDVPEGLNYAYFTTEMGHPEPVFAWRSKFHDLLYKVDRTEPCRTIKAQPGKFTGPFHWKNRHFTIEELKRLQSFPDDFEIVGSYGKVVEQIGNSVPPRLGFVVAQSVREQLLEPTDELTFATRPDDFVSTFRSRQRDRSKKFRNIASAAIAAKYSGSTSFLPPVKKEQSFIVGYDGLFNRVKSPKKSSRRTVAVEVTDAGELIDVRFKPSRGDGHQTSVEINLEGLKKYLPNYDVLRLEGALSATSDIFHAWKEIEVALVARSRFFTLIDIYGHYANRGDTVRISTNLSSPTNEPIQRALQFFSQSLNCGGFHTEKHLMTLLEVGRVEWRTIITALRELRYDVRTSLTHPIIGEGRVLCTYPFPLLSPRALVESKVLMNPRATSGETMEYV